MRRSSSHFSARKFICVRLFSLIAFDATRRETSLEKTYIRFFSTFADKQTELLYSAITIAVGRKIEGKSNSKLHFVSDICGPRCFRWIKKNESIPLEVNPQGCFYLRWLAAQAWSNVMNVFLRSSISLVLPALLFLLLWHRFRIDKNWLNAISSESHVWSLNQCQFIRFTNAMRVSLRHSATTKNIRRNLTAQQIMQIK